MKVNIVDLDTKTDERGSLSQNVSEEVKNQMKHFFVSYSNPGSIRGQHYHTKKIEWFYIIKGEAEIVLENIKTKERKKLKSTSDKPQLVKMEPGIAHAIKNTGKEEMILLALVNESLDQNNPDTFPYKVI